MMNDAVTGELLRTMEEQSEVIMRQADSIARLSALLLQHCEVTQAEIDAISGRRNDEEVVD